MDEKFLQQLHAEMLESQNVANAILMLAVARQLDGARLRADIQAILADMKTQPTPLPGATARLLSATLGALPRKRGH